MIECKLKDNVQFYEDGNIPDITEFENNEEPIFMIFDDLVNAEKKVQQKISEYFLRGRKMNITSLYLSQSYFKTPKFIRINCSNIFLRRISSKRDLATILRDYVLGVSIKDLMHIYQYATSKPSSFLGIYLDCDDENNFKLNFDVINI